MVHSMESSRPIMAPSVSSNRASKRFSTFSGAPSVAPSVASTTQGDPRLQEIKEWTTGLERLENEKMQQQRYTPTSEKTDEIAQNAITAKIQRALDRRMTSQDAVMRPRPKKSPTEKSG